MLPKAGKTTDSMKGVYFGNIFGDEFSFDLMYNLISRDSTEKNNLDSYLSELNHVPSEVCYMLRIMSMISFGIATKTINGLMIFMKTFFPDNRKQSTKMLEHCFVSDSKLDQFKGEIKER